MKRGHIDAILRALRDVSPSDQDAPMREDAAELIERQVREIEILRYETAKCRAMFEHAVQRLVAISGFAHPGGIVVNGLGYSYNPPIELVREAWEALSKAIREIDVSTLREAGQNPAVTSAKPAVEDNFDANL